MSSTEPTTTIPVYSDDHATRERVRLALGRRPAADLPRVEYIEAATHAAAIKTLEAGGIDLAILDGEAAPSGGLGIARQMKDEIFQAPPVLVLLLGHLFEDLGGGRKRIAQALSVLAIDAPVLLLEGDGERENLARLQICKRFHCERPPVIPPII